jgi:hypothetical protein
MPGIAKSSVSKLVYHLGQLLYLMGLYQWTGQEMASNGSMVALQRNKVFKVNS